MANVARLRTEPFFGHNREELTRIMIQSLADLGYSSAANTLIQESGYELEGPTVAQFREAVLQGQWEEAEILLFGSEPFDGGGGVGLMDNKSALGPASGRTSRQSWSPKRQVRGLTLSEGANKDEMKFQLREQKYLELLESRDVPTAVVVLRQELTPLRQDVTRLHTLSR
jgi:WD repeat-containing protein 26